MQKKLYWLIHDCSCEPVVVFLLCKQWFISFFCIGGINMFDFYVFQSKSYKFANLYELVCQCACMEVFLNVCLVFVCKVSRSSSVCVFPVCLSSKRRTSFLQRQHSSTAVVLRFNPFLFFSYQWCLSLFPPLSLLYPISLMFNLSLHHSIYMLVRKGGSCFIVFFSHISPPSHI